MEGLTKKFSTEKNKEKVGLIDERAFNFVEDNFELLKKLYTVEYEKHKLLFDAENFHSSLGELDKDKFSKKIEFLKENEDRLLEELVRKIKIAEGIDFIANDDGLLKIFEAVLKERKSYEEDGEVSDDDGWNDEYSEYFPEIIKKIKVRLLEEERASKDKNENSNSLQGMKEEIKIDEERRLQHVRGILKPNRESGKDDEFDSQKELIAIKSINREEMSLKKERVAKYKRKLANQLFGMSKINLYLEYNVLDDPSVSLDYLREELERLTEGYGLSHWQKARYENVLSAFEKAREATRERWEKYADVSIIEMVKEFVGEKYDFQGKIEAKNHVMTIVFLVYDHDDYAKILLENPDVVSASEKEQMNAKDTAAFFDPDTGLIFVDMSGKRDLEELEDIIKHEMKHCLNEIVNKSINRYDIEHAVNAAIDYSEMNIEQYFEAELQYALSEAKDEILACLREGEDIYYMEDMLLEKGGNYDFMDADIYIKRKDGKGDDYDEERDEVLKGCSWEDIEERLMNARVKYKELIYETTSLLEELEMFGFSKEEMVGIFQAESIVKWRKVYVRLNNSLEFLAEKKSNIQRRLQELPGEIEVAKKGLKEFKNNMSLFFRIMIKINGKIPQSLNKIFGEQEEMRLSLEENVSILSENEEYLEATLNDME